MKDRIRKKIKKDESLKDNLNLLDSSYITTFDSFALSVVKRYHYLLNISKNINIIEKSLIDIQKNKIMDEIFLEYYEQNNPLFLKMIDIFCIKDDTEIRNYFINISNKLDLLSNKEEYLNNYLKTNYNDKKLESDIKDYLNIIKDKQESIKDLIKEISYLDNDFSQKIKDNLSLLLEDFNDYDELKTKLNIKLPSSPRGSEEEIKDKRKEISELIKEIEKYTIYKDKDEIKNSILKTYPTIEIMIEIILKFTKKVMDYKKNINCYEFNDIAILAIKIVKENSEAREELKEFFQEIMIDEYQDTNDLQEEFINMISKNNTYMVGDIKQSIYRFRNANPYIFKNKYDNYSLSKKDKKIDLNKNFRSRKEVLDNINLIFNQIMNDTIGGANYPESHQMIFGNTKYLEEKVSHNNDLEILTYEYNKDLNYTKEEIEIFITAKDIKDKINKKIQIFDKETSKLRNIKYDDFAIIIDRSTSFDLYKKIFNYFNIPVTLLKDEKLNEETDIKLLSNLIRLIIKVESNKIDTEFKYLFTSIERSFLFQEKDPIIFNYFKNNNFKESSLYKKCKEINKLIPYITITELLDIIVEEFNYFEKYITIGNIKEGIIKYQTIKDSASNLESLGYNIEEFSNYLNELLEKEYIIEYKIPENNTSSVKIMTIHKSKGLEYPICYFTNLYKEFNIRDLKDKFLIDKKLGIIVPYFDNGINTTIYKDLLKRNYIEEEISEKIRLFYVALTRAREKIILITPKEEKKYYQITTQIPDKIKINYRSFKDILDSITFFLKDKEKPQSIDNLLLTKDYTFQKEISYEDKIDKTNDTFKTIELNIDNIEIDINTFSKKTNKLLTKEEKEFMNYGTKIHEYLEYLDFKNPNLEIIDDNFCKDKILKFLKQDILKDISIATIYQEYEFIYEEDYNTYHGIIDLMLEYNNHIDIIDYKLKNIEDNSYKRQLEGYKKYIETKTNKKINIYLYSLIDEKLLTIN